MCTASNDGDLVETYGSEIFIDNHEYSILEVSVDGICDSATYAECKAKPEFVNEFLFRFKPPPGSTLFPKSILAHRPEASINFPKEGDFVSATTSIRYEAKDEDDSSYASFGLGTEPVSLYYADDLDHWMQIARRLPPAGEFLWDASFLSDGEYWIKILAEDQSGERDEEISGPFGIDRISPVFDVSADPQITRGERVKITVNASEPLSQSPEVMVRQRGYADVPVFVQKAETLMKSDFANGAEVLVKSDFAREVWEGEYEVRGGADGTAVISVKGRDLAGNISSIIRNGGTFSVGVEPPPKPVIIAPLDGEIVRLASSSAISLKGKIREDTLAVIFLNGEKFAEVKPDAEGIFSIENIPLLAEFQQGLNLLRVVSRDGAGNESEAVSVSVKLNSSPLLKILTPRAEEILHGTSTLRMEARDPNGDALSFNYALREASSSIWTVLADAVSQREFSFDTREFADGEYILRVQADDGSEKNEIFLDKFIIKNFRSIILLDAGGRTLVNINSATIRGGVSIPRGAERRIDIVAVEYSLDGGATWAGARASDGVFDTPEEKFVFALQDLGEGYLRILLRARDSRGYFGKTSHELMVDFGPPPVPEIIVPLAGIVLGDAEDADPELAGMQFILKGRAEPGNTVIADIGTARFETKSIADGNFSIKATAGKHGENNISVRSTDPAGNKSPGEDTLKIIYNNPPDIKFLRPKEGGGVNHTAEVLAEVQDRDLDAIREVNLWYRRPGEDNKRLIRKISGPSAGDSVLKFIWDVSGLPEGRYELIAEASDGVSVNSLTREVLVDNTPPEILAEPMAQNVFTKSFTLEIRGEARDGFSGIEYVEYRINRVSKSLEVEPPSGGSTSLDFSRWLKAIITSGYREKNARFRVRHPVALPDGEYEVKFRSSDSAGNISGESLSQKITVDSTPPRIGSFAVTSGPIALLPEEGSFLVPSGVEFSFAISLEKDANKASLIIGSEETHLNREGGIWRGKFTVSGEEKNFVFQISAEDVLGNKTGKKILGAFSIVENGRVTSGDKTLSGAHLSVFEVLEEGGERVLWDGTAFGVKNPMLTDDSGNYELLLPAGRYEILLQKEGYRRVRTSAFTLTRPAFIYEDMEMEERRGLRGFIEDKLEKWGY